MRSIKVAGRAARNTGERRRCPIVMRVPAGPGRLDQALEGCGMDASKTGKEAASAGGYGILASLERESAGATVREAGPRDSRASRSVLVAGAGLVALLGWWWCSNSTPAVALPAKPVWHAPVARPAVVPVALPDEPALIVNDAPLLPPLPSPKSAPAAPPVAARPAVPTRRERVSARTPAKPVRRDIVHAEVAPRVPAPADHDVSLLTALVAHQNGVTLPSRDVVEPRLADSTAALLQRCGRVGGEEGRLCRVRICAERRLDAACGD